MTNGFFLACLIIGFICLLMLEVILFLFVFGKSKKEDRKLILPLFICVVFCGCVCFGDKLPDLHRYLGEHVPYYTVVFKSSQKFLNEQSQNWEARYRRTVSKAKYGNTYQI